MKNPCGQCTVAIAPIMMAMKPAAVNLVRNPAINPRLPSDSPMMTRNATSQGSPIFWVKNPIVPSKPFPPNQPNNFCAPCANITLPSPTRRMRPAQESSVLKNVAMILSLSAHSLLSSFKLTCTLRSSIPQNNRINNFAALHTPSERHVSFTAAQHGIETLFHHHESRAPGTMDGLGDHVPFQSIAPVSLVLPQLNRCRHDKPPLCKGSSIR